MTTQMTGEGHCNPLHRTHTFFILPVRVSIPPSLFRAFPDHAPPFVVCPLESILYTVPLLSSVFSSSFFLERKSERRETKRQIVGQTEVY